jgi:hypothetical protein
VDGNRADWIIHLQHSLDEFAGQAHEHACDEADDGRSDRVDESAGRDRDSPSERSRSRRVGFRNESTYRDAADDPVAQIVRLRLSARKPPLPDIASVEPGLNPNQPNAGMKHPHKTHDVVA